MPDSNKLTEETQFIAALKDALIALKVALDLTEEEEAETRLDVAWDAVLDIHQKTCKLIELFEDHPEMSAETLFDKIALIWDGPGTKAAPTT